MAATPDPPAMVEPHDCDRCGDTYDEAGGDGYAGLCPRCADETDDPAEGWDCPRGCGYRTPDMTLTDRDLLTTHIYDAHVRAQPADR